MPTRDQLLAEAQSMFAKTISLDDIVDRAHELLVESVCLVLAVPPVAANLNLKPATTTGGVNHGHPPAG
jgi:stearoyl-CoA desaturase (delta-9 desaturase)